MQIFLISDPPQPLISTSITQNTTIQDLTKNLSSSINLTDQYITFGGRPLHQGIALHEYGVTDGSTLCLMTRVRGGGCGKSKVKVPQTKTRTGINLNESSGQEEDFEEVVNKAKRKKKQEKDSLYEKLRQEIMSTLLPKIDDVLPSKSEQISEYIRNQLNRKWISEYSENSCLQFDFPIVRHRNVNHQDFVILLGEEDAYVVYNKAQNKKMLTLGIPGGNGSMGLTAKGITAEYVAPDGEQIAFGTSDGQIFIYDFEERECTYQAIIDQQENAITALSLAVIQDQQYVVANVAKKGLHFFNVNTKTKESPVGPNMLENINSIYIDDNYDYLALIHDKTKLQVQSLVSGNPKPRVLPQTKSGPIDEDQINLQEVNNTMEPLKKTKDLESFNSVDSIDDGESWKTLFEYDDPIRGVYVSTVGQSDYLFVLFDEVKKNQVVSLEDQREITQETFGKKLLKGFLSNRMNVKLKGKTVFVQKQTKNAKRIPDDYGFCKNVAISSDSKYVVAGMSDGQIHVYSLDTKEKVATFRDDRTIGVRPVAITPSSEFVICGTDEGTIKIYDFKRQTLFHSFEKAHTEGVNCVAVTNNSELVVSGSGDKTIKVFHIQSRTEKAHFQNIHDKDIEAIAISKDDRFIATGSYDASIRVLLHQEKEMYTSFDKAHDHAIYCVTFTSDSKYLVSGSYDKSIKIFDLETKQQVYHFKNAHSQGVWSVAVSPDIKYIVSSSSDCSIKIFNFETKDLIHEFYYAHTETVLTVAISPDSRYIVSGSEDKSIKIFSFSTGGEKAMIMEKKYKLNEEHLSAMEISHKKDLVLCGMTDGHVILYSIETHEELLKIRLHNTPVTAVQFTQDDSCFLTSDWTKVILYSTTKRQKLKTVKPFRGETGKIADMALSNDDSFFVSVTDEGAIKGYSFEQNDQIWYQEEYHKGAINKVCIADDLSYILTGSNDRSVKVKQYILENSKTKPYQFERILPNEVTALSIAPDCVTAAAGSKDGSVKILNVYYKEVIYFLEKHHNGRITSLNISGDNINLVSCSSDKSIQIFNIQTKGQVYTYKYLHESPVIESRNCADFKTSVSVSQDGEIKTFSLYPSEMYFANHCKNATSSSVLFARHIFNQTSDLNHLLQDYKDFALYPYGWNLLHIVSIFYPKFFRTKGFNYTKFKVPFEVDNYHKTPLHYLLGYENINYLAVNDMMAYMVDYLEDEQVFNDVSGLHEIHSLFDSLSPIYPILFHKIKPSTVNRFLRLWSQPVFVPYGKELDEYGLIQKNKISLQPHCIITPEVEEEIFSKEGNQLVQFRALFTKLDYRPYSTDMYHFIFILLENQNEDYYKNKVISRLIEYLWKEHWKFHLYLASIFSLLMIMLSIYAIERQSNIALEVLMLIMGFGFTLYEIFQMRTFGLRQHFESIWNVNDVAFLPVLMINIAVSATSVESEMLKGWLMSFSLLLGYLRWVSYLRIFAPTRNLLRIIFEICKDMLSFVIVLGFTIVCFSLMFLQFEDERNLRDVIFYVYLLMYAEIGDTEDTFDFSRRSLLVILTFILSVVLLNLLIAIMADSYERVQEKKVLTEANERLDMMMESMIFVRRFILKKHAKDKIDRGFMIYCEEMEDDDDDEENSGNNQWEGRINVLKRLIQKNHKLIEKVVNDQREMQNIIEDQVKNQLNDLSRRLDSRVAQKQIFPNISKKMI